jgi:hypothetical protein
MAHTIKDMITDKGKFSNRKIWNATIDSARRNNAIDYAQT